MKALRRSTRSRPTRSWRSASTSSRGSRSRRSATEQAEKRKRLKEIEALLARARRRAGSSSARSSSSSARSTATSAARASRAGEELEYDPEAYIVHEEATVVLSRDGWIKRVREVKDPAATRLREGDALAARAAGDDARPARALLEPRARSTCCASPTCRRRPATASRCSRCSSSATASASSSARLVREPDDAGRAGAAGAARASGCRGGRRRSWSRRRAATASAPRPDLSETTRAGRRLARVGDGDEVVSVEPIERPGGGRRDGAAARCCASPLDEVAELVRPRPRRHPHAARPSGRPHRRRAGARREGRRSWRSRPRAASASSGSATCRWAGARGKGQKVVKRGGVAAIRRVEG